MSHRAWGGGAGSPYSGRDGWAVNRTVTMGKVSCVPNGSITAMAQTVKERQARWRERHPVRSRAVAREAQQRRRDSARAAKREVIHYPGLPADPAGAICEWARAKLVIPPGHIHEGQPFEVPDYGQRFLKDALAQDCRDALISTASIERGGIVIISGGAQSQSRELSAIPAGAIGAGFSQPSVALLETQTRLVCGAMGVPSSLLLADGDGAAARESFRRFAAATIAPILDAVKTEWGAKIGPLLFSMDALRASDETARARALGSRSTAFKNLVAGGVEVEKALELAGLA